MVVVVLFTIPFSVTNTIRSTVKNAISPVLAILYQQSGIVRRFSIISANINSLPKENDQLSAEVTRLLVENSNLKEVAHENELLRNELNISGALSKRKLVGARIISRSAFVFQDIITIDKGSNDGLAVGQPVTSGGALMGKIINVGKDSSDVELITSSNAVTQVQLQNSRTFSILRGGIRGLVVEFIPQDVAATEGEMIITSGLGGEMRQGLTVGTVDRVISQKNEVFQRVSIKPAANISRADLVFIEINE
jgi:rod shape-determining protein MreC